MSILMVRYVGLDVHKRVVEVCIVNQAGKVVHRERFALNRRTLKTFATKVLRPTDHVALEATTNCWAVADALRPHVAKGGRKGDATLFFGMCTENTIALALERVGKSCVPFSVPNV
jgi:hypothetical protein